jgi:hypothetical protein
MRRTADGLKDRERRREHLQHELHSLNALPALQQTTQSLRLDVLKHLDEWRGVLGKHVSTSRQLLRKMIDGRLVFSPQQEGEDTWYELAGQGSLEKFFAGIPLIKAGMSPTGLVNPWYPRVAGWMSRAAREWSRARPCGMGRSGTEAPESILHPPLVDLARRI